MAIPVLAFTLPPNYLWYVLLFVLASSLVVAVFCYVDAKKNAMGGKLWFIIGLIGGILSLVVYLMARKTHRARPKEKKGPIAEEDIKHEIR